MFKKTTNMDHSIDNSVSMDTSARNLLASDSHRDTRRQNKEYQNPSYYRGLGSLNKKESLVNPHTNSPTPRFKMNQSYQSSISGVDMASISAAGGAAKITTNAEENGSTETRAQLNWKKLRKLVKTSIVEQRLNGLMGEKDKRIQLGQKMDEPVAKQTYREMLRTFYIHPKGNFLIIWKGFLQIMILFYVITYTQELSFGDNLYDSDPFDIINIIVDCLCFINIIINFLTGVKLTNNSILWNKKTMAKNYLYYGTLIPDVISIIPYEFCVRNLAILKLIRLIHFRGFSKTLLKLTDRIVPIFVGGLKAIVVAKFIAGFAGILSGLVIFFHITSCIWVQLGYRTYSGEDTWFDAVVTYDANDDIVYYKDQELRIYVTSLFHIVQTVTTIGYGNSTGYTLREYVYSLVLMFIGLLMFAFVFEKMKAIIKSLNEAEELNNQHVEELDSWLNRMDRNIIESIDVYNELLTNSFKRTLRHKLDQHWQDLFLGNEQYRHLSHKMKQQVLRVSFRNYERRFYVLLKFLSQSFMDDLFLLSESRLYLAKEVVIEKGEVSKGLFLVLEGTVLIAESSPEEPFMKLKENTFFGENFLLTNKGSKFYFIASSDLSCLFINESDFAELEKEYPEDAKKFRHLAYARESHFSNSDIRTCLVKPRAKRSSNQRHTTIGRISNVRMSQHQSYINLLPTETTGEKKSTEFQKTNLFGESMNLPESIILPNARNSQISSGLPRPQRNGEVIFPRKGRTSQTQIFPDYKRVPSSIEGISPIISPQKEKYSESIVLEGSPDKSGPIKPFDWESVFELDSSPYINESPLIQFNQQDIELETENAFDNDGSQKPEKAAQKKSEDNAEDEEILREKDELNSSNIFPLECAIPDFDDPTQQDKIVSYLQERMTFVRNKLSLVKTKLDVDGQYLTHKANILHKKLQ